MMRRTGSDWAAGESLDSLPETMGEVVESLWQTTGRLRKRKGATRGDDQILSGSRVAIVTNLPAHYRIPLFTGLARRLEASGGSLRVFFLASGASGRPWLGAREGLQFDHEFLRSIPLPLRRRRPPFLPFDLRRRLRAYDPTIVLAAGFSPFSTLEAAAHARRRGVAFGIWSGETPALAPRGRLRALRAIQRRRLLDRADFAIAYGSLAERYLRSLAPRLPVVIGRNTSVAGVSDSRQGEGTRDRRADGGRRPIRARQGDRGGGRGAWTREGPSLPPQRGRWTARRRLGARGARARDDRIRFLGPLPHAEVMTALEKSDVFLFPSRVDPFGLALVEAMAAELAAIVSPAPGAVADLAVSGHNCLVVKGMTHS